MDDQTQGETRRWLVSGRVQGVGFRWFTKATARSLRLAGWVHNLPDGRVEVVAGGDTGDLEALRRWLGRGPPGARVDNVEKIETEVEVDTFKPFYIK